MKEISYYHIYGLKECEYCQDAIELLENHKIDYVVTYYDNSNLALTFIKAVLDHPTVPIIYAYHTDKSFKKIGGFTQLKEELDRCFGQ